MKIFKLIFAVAAVAFLSSCTKTMTLEDIGKMSAAERAGLTEVYLKVDLPPTADIDLWTVFEGCTNLTDIEIDKSYQGSISNKYYSRSSSGPANIRKIVALGATKLVGGAFEVGSREFAEANTKLAEFVMPNLKEMGRGALGRFYTEYSNQITELDFKVLNIFGGENIEGCRHLKVLKLGNDGPIWFFDDCKNIDTKQIDLYIGKYEYEHHVKGNVFYPHWYLSQFGDTLDPDSGEPNGDPIEFKSIHPY